MLSHPLAARVWEQDLHLARDHWKVYPLSPTPQLDSHSFSKPNHSRVCEPFVSFQ